MPSKRVSLDEFLNSKTAGDLSRKHFARDSGVVLKAAHVDGEKRAKYQKGSGLIAFVMSAEIEDRDRDIVIQAGLDTTEFEKNPVAPWGHRSSDFPVGKWTDLSKNLTGRPKRTEGTLVLTMADPNAIRLDAHYAAGSLAACSIGFMPKDIERRPQKDDEDYYYPGYMIHSAELYECSPCTIPANPAALAKAARDGDTLSRELIEEVLDTWKLENGLIMPRKAFEDAHAASKSADKTTFSFGGKTFVARENPAGGAPLLTLQEPSETERLVEGLEKDEGLLGRFMKALGLKAETPPADPAAALETGKKEETKPVSAEDEVRKSIAKDLPALTRKHDLIEADAKFARLEAELETKLSA